MQRISYRLAAATLVLALLIIPVSAQAAPIHSDTEAWGASVLTTVQSWLDSAWGAVEIVISLTPGDETTTVQSATESEPDPDTSSEALQTIDPNG